MAAEQHGLLVRRQMLAAGMTQNQVVYLLRKNELIKRFQGIYAVAAAPVTWQQHVLAAVYWGGGGAAASHRTAARLWQLDGFARDVIDISIPRTRTRCPDPRVRIHSSASLLANGLVRIEAIPTTDIPRTLIDLASVLDPAALEGVVDDVLRRRLASVNELVWRLNQFDGSTKNGIGTLRTIARARADGPQAISGSNVELKAARELRRARLPSPVRQFLVRDQEGRMFIDLAYPDVMLAIEIDSWKWHSSRKSWENDRRKDARLRALGWTVLRFSWGDVEERPRRFVAEIRAELRRRGAI